MKTGMNDMRRLMRLFRPYRIWVVGGIALGCVVILANVALLALSGWFIAGMALAGLGPQSISYFAPAALIRGLAILRTGARYGERLVTHEATLRFLAELRVWFYERLEPLGPAAMDSWRGGDLLARIRSDIDSLDNFYLRILAPVINALICSIVIVAGLALYDGRVAALDLVALLLAVLVIPLMVQKFAASAGRGLTEIRSALDSAATDTTRGLGELFVLGAFERQRARVLELGERLIAAQRRQMWVGAIGRALSGLVGNLAMWGALVLVIPLVAAGDMPGPQLAMLALWVLASFEAVAPLPMAFAAFGETAAAARRIFEIADATPAVRAPDAAIAKVPACFDLTLTDVSMRYRPESDWALQDFSLSLAEGESVGLVGESGAGKSTLLALVQRFREFQSGEITIGGVDLREISEATLRQTISVVAQRTHLFNASIRDNLLLAKPDASDDELHHALKLAGLEDEISNFPDGLDTLVGEVGTRLSGGQARRVAIARAFLRDARILLLDEPTEGLDADSEARVLEALGKLMQGKTTLLVSHWPRALAFVGRVEKVGHEPLHESRS
ncbi:thiol reductant ABC exporter subunit CydC [Salinicola rhizosphaerae]|uniref:Thiol reductant ABC exporter subunit CydC n=1 Tax=Salinicola rhizosphaerae TaxID=1443141 RepID=A0ABQ3DU23_9GAMM|nr:thiol reductant ABC exporter subunit CydC [Salinicola rhizosphaerae]GHB13241.1 thiol reductant ABC exporter subunit CydC [Salinicola rhizosphaerae]